MSTTFKLESGYASVHLTTLEEIVELISEITPETLLKRCKELGIEKLHPEKNAFEEYCNVYLTKNDGYFVERIEDYPKHEYIAFHCGGGGDHRNTAEFVIKTICLMVLEKAITQEYNIIFKSI